MTAPESGDAQSGVAEVLAAHRYRDVLGDYEVEPFYRHFGCSCGWEQDIAGMNGYWSWLAAHEAHVAAAISPLLAAERAKAVEAVAREWQFGGWTILTAPPPGGAIPALALGQRVTDWLADRIEQTSHQSARNGRESDEQGETGRGYVRGATRPQNGDVEGEA